MMIVPQTDKNDKGSLPKNPLSLYRQKCDPNNYQKDLPNYRLLAKLCIAYEKRHPSSIF